MFRQFVTRGNTGAATRADSPDGVFNANRAETLAPFDRIEGILRLLGARLIIQHSMEDFALLPRVPDHLE